MNVSIVVPVYNSEESLLELAKRIDQVLGGADGKLELVFVNDGSRDQSWRQVQQLAAAHPWVVGIDLMRNYGQHNALLCGIRAATNEVIVTLDDDLQNPPEEIPKLLDCLREGRDVVYGVPRTQQHGLWRDVASYVTKLTLQGAMGAETATKVSAFRAFRRDLRGAFSDFRGPYVSLDVLLTWATTSFGSVVVEHQRRLTGRSNYTLSKLLVHSLNMMTGFSTLPLQLASLVGFASTIFGVVLLLFVLGRYLLEGGVVPGFAFLASAIAIFSGAQLFAIGIFGEYLARMHFRVMDRPAYAVRTVVGKN
ncbi:MAG: glycosyltransferase family 2 protein [Bryobacterales bacterium]